MAPRTMETSILMIFTVVALMSGERAIAVDCSSLILNMADCLSFVTNGSTVEKPEGTCCSGLKTVVRSGPECICEGFKNSASLGVTLDLAKAASLPSACKVAAPPSARCGRKFSFYIFYIVGSYIYGILLYLVLKMLCLQSLSLHLHLLVPLVCSLMLCPLIGYFRFFFL